jgi:hypothetical protein
MLSLSFLKVCLVDPLTLLRNPREREKDMRHDVLDSVQLTSLGEPLRHPVQLSLKHVPQVLETLCIL